MVAIDKRESQEIRKRFPFACIYRTARQRSKRHRYFVSEEPPVLAFLREFREKTEKEGRNDDI